MELARVLVLCFSLVLYLLVTGFVSSLIIVEVKNAVRIIPMPARRKLSILFMAAATVLILSIAAATLTNAVVEALK